MSDIEDVIEEHNLDLNNILFENHTNMDSYYLMVLKY